MRQQRALFMYLTAICPLSLLWSSGSMKAWMVCSCQGWSEWLAWCRLCGPTSEPLSRTGQTSVPTRGEKPNGHTKQLCLSLRQEKKTSDILSLAVNVFLFIAPSIFSWVFIWLCSKCISVHSLFQLLIMSQWFLFMSEWLFEVELFICCVLWVYCPCCLLAVWFDLEVHQFPQSGLIQLSLSSKCLLLKPYKWSKQCFFEGS